MDLNILNEWRILGNLYFPMVTELKKLMENCFFPFFIVSRIVIQFFYLTELKSGQINNWVYVHHLVSDCHLSI